MSEPLEGGRKRRASRGGVFSFSGEAAPTTEKEAKDAKLRAEGRAVQLPGRPAAAASLAKAAVRGVSHNRFTAKAGRRRRGKKVGKTRRHRR